MIKKMLVTAALTALAFVGVASTSTTPANAWGWSSYVTLQGTSRCTISPTTWVWVSAPNGESGWATAGNGRYFKAFQRVPSGGMTVRINYGNGFSCHDDVRVFRPTVGTNLTVNLTKIVPNG